MENRQLFGIIGSLLLFVGVFAPIVSVPIMGNINYFQNGKGDGSFILVLAIISFVLILTRNYRGLWFTSIGVLIVMLLTFVNFHSKMNELKTQLNGGSSGTNLFQGLADMAMQSVQLQWGWALLLAGLALLVAAAAMGESLTPTNNMPHPQTRSTNIAPINWMPVFVGLGVMVILFLIGILWNIQDSNPTNVATPNTTVQTNQTIQQLQQENAMQDVRQQALREAQQRLAETAQQTNQPDLSTLNIQPNQGNNQQVVSEAVAREELVAFFQQYYAALNTNDVPTLERLWNMNSPQATKSINIIKSRTRKGIRGQGCNINTAQIRSFTPSPTQATIYIDAICDMDGSKTDRFHSNFDLEKNLLGEWKLLKQVSEK
jgi:hypothetical protein